ncbi:MAG: Cytochrome c551 peroxidase [Fimbriimonadaceae bacterium]|nr:Cytochrome c551 peroxidase [Fimbriimonadaceae bacterium]
MPDIPYKYADPDVGYPRHIVDPNTPGNVDFADNTPPNNPITNEGATLGRVLFYDKQLSRNRTVSCGSCHQQKHGFSDPNRFSKGLNGALTDRHAPGLSSARYYPNGRFVWDERAPTLEAQVLQPIQNAIEMDLTLPEAIQRIRTTPFYGKLFNDAFGSTDVTAERISRALAQFVRSMVSYRTKWDSAFDANGQAHFQQTLTPKEFLGLRLFQPIQGFPNISRGCNNCHVAASQISTRARNNGLDLNTPGGGRFKSPSLRDIAVRAPYMHDGRFASLMDVVEFYNSGVQNNPNLDPLLRDGQGNVRRLNLTQQEKEALVAFLETLTDTGIATDPKFSDPFVPPLKITPHP